MFYEIENWVKGQELVYGFADLVGGSGFWVSGFRNCAKSKDFVWKQLKKTVNNIDHSADKMSLWKKVENDI